MVSQEYINLMEADKFKESLNFVTSHYREGAFRPDPDLFRTKRSFQQLLRRHGVAAAVVAGILTVAACAVVLSLRDAEIHEQLITPAETEQSVEPTVENTADSVVKLEFTDAPLSEVVEEIEKSYNVTVENIPATDLRLTLSYEGTATDLVDTINELLGTKLKISE